MKLIHTEIRYGNNAWVWTDPISGQWATSALHERSQPRKTKKEFIRSVALTLKAYVKEQGLAFSLAICGKNGKYIEERSYGHDPRKSKG